MARAWAAPGGGETEGGRNTNRVGGVNEAICVISKGPIWRDRAPCGVRVIEAIATMSKAIGWARAYDRRTC